MSARVILWGYKGSPFVHKTELMLLIKDIPHYKVDVSMKPPRPELSDLLGISYRKVPVVAIGSDVYCDTTLIADALEEHFPVERYSSSTLFPLRKDERLPGTLLTKSLTHFFGDKVLFNLGGKLLPWEKVPNLKEDRIQFFGGSLPELIANRPRIVSELHAHMVLLEDQLKDDRTWLLDTFSPGLADASIFAFTNWLQGLRVVREQILLSGFYPKILLWMGRFRNWVEQVQKANRAPFETISGEAAVDLIRENKSKDTEVDGMVDPVDALRWGLKPGYQVSVCPNDTGKVPTTGTLLALNHREVVIETVGSAGLPVRVHFPRIGYELRHSEKLAKL